jgi:hypothetical protein
MSYRKPSSLPPQDLLLYVVGSSSTPLAPHKLLPGSRLAVRDLLEGAGLLDGQVRV